LPHARVNIQHRTQAKTLRRAMTRAETLLWRYLEAHHLDGLQFRRQTPIGPYIADFCCHAARIIVEVDGATHDFEERLKRDAIRDRWFAAEGYRVLRFINDDVLRRLEGVISVIRKAAAKIAPPSLSLPHKGGGNDNRQAGA
jgi:very-short-patch-repair endonuclease